MHIPDGVLSGSPEGIAVLGAGVLLAGVGTAIGLVRMDYHHMPRVAMLSSAFFVASLINVPVGTMNVHPVLNGLMGLVLGWAAFPAMLVALFLQAMFFGFGGLTTLGLNTLNMALPAVVCHYVFRRAMASPRDKVVFWAAAGAGAASILLSACLMAASFALAGKAFGLISRMTLLAYPPIALIEGFLTASVILFLRRVRPELILDAAGPHALAEVSHG